MKDRLLYSITCLLLCILLSCGARAATISPLSFRYQVTGIQNPLIEKNVTLSLLNYRSDLHFPIRPEEMRRFIRRGPHVIEKAVKPYGYFHATVSTTQENKAGHHWVIFDVTLGQPLRLSAVTVDVTGQGMSDHKYQHYLKKLPLQTGDILDTTQYESIKEKLYDLATERGYFKAKMITSQIKINLKKYTARITIVFDTGPRFRFGQTTFSQTPFNESFLKKYLEYQIGHHYNAKKLEKTQTALVASNYFNQVLITPEPKEAVNNAVPIHVSLILRKRKGYTFGLGYGTDTGARATIGYSIRRIGKNGQRFHTLLRASQDNSSFTAKYIIPGPHPAHDLFTVGAGASNIIQSTGTANNVKLAVNYTFFDRHWKNTLTLAYLNERYNILSLPKTTAQLVFPTFESKYTDSDHLTHPTRGVTATLQLSGADKNVLSETDFLQETLNVDTLYTIKPTHTRLLFRTDFGHTDIPNLDNLPLSLQLFAGGSLSVRGYAYNSIGPGRNLVVGSAEIQERIIGPLYLAGFVDAGVVGNNNIFQHINAGSGPGIAWVSPVGTMELTAAEAFTQLNKPWVIQFTMGTAI